MYVKKSLTGYWFKHINEWWLFVYTIKKCKTQPYPKRAAAHLLPDILLALQIQTEFHTERLSDWGRKRKHRHHRYNQNTCLHTGQNCTHSLGESCPVVQPGLRIKGANYNIWLSHQCQYILRPTVKMAWHTFNQGLPKIKEDVSFICQYLFQSSTCWTALFALSLIWIKTAYIHNTEIGFKPNPHAPSIRCQN